MEWKSLGIGIKRILRKSTKNLFREKDIVAVDTANQLREIKGKLIGNCQSVEKQGAIYIGEVLSQGIECLNLGRVVFALGLNQKEKLKIIPIYYQKSELTKMLTEAYCLSHGISIHRKSLLDFVDSLHALIVSLLYAVKNGTSPEKLLRLEMKGIRVGDALYDYLLKVNGVVTIDKIDWKRDLFYIWESMKLIYVVFRQFRKVPPLYYLCWDDTYLEGIVLEAASKMGANVILLSDNVIVENPKREYMYSWDTVYRKIAAEAVKGDNPDLSLVDGYFDKLKKNTTTDINVFVNLENQTKKYRLKDNGKKNVIIFSHCFTDAPRHGDGRLYRDYYTWLIETIKIAKKIDTVNWYVKEHPHSILYKGEGGTINGIPLGENITMLPRNISNEDMMMEMDCVVTCSGTAGAEYPCLGIPAVVASKAWYSGFGFTVDADSVEQYEENLKKIYKLNGLNQNQITTAKVVFNAYLNTRSYNKEDALNTMIMKAVIKTWNAGADNKEFFKEFLRIPDVSGTEAYCKGTLWE